MTPALWLYRTGTAALEPFAPMLLRRRARAGKEDELRIGERLGWASAPRPPGRLVWVHGASVGESLSHLPLVERLRAERPDCAVLVTSGTRTSAALLAQRLPEEVIHQFAPVDAPGVARRFAGYWRPDLALFVESELWPNLICQTRAVGARMGLVSARISEHSIRNWRRAPAAARDLIAAFDLALPQDQRTADWLSHHGARIGQTLDLKRLADPLPYDRAELERLRALTAGRRVLVAASTHAGEEEVIGDVVSRLPGSPLLIVVPRHPERGEAAETALEGAGLRAGRRSAGDQPGPHLCSYVADTLGELGLFYRLADAALIGGSLLPGLSGHNPWEAARLGKAIVTGAHTESFAEAYAELASRRAALIARGPAELAGALAAVVTEPEVAKTLGDQALAACDGARERFDRALAQIAELIPA
jgi:3-deoxy-D-manno-octulosonic-acid transferase